MNIFSLIGAVGLSAVCGFTQVQPKRANLVIDSSTNTYTFNYSYFNEDEDFQTFLNDVNDGTNLLNGDCYLILNCYNKSQGIYFTNSGLSNGSFLTELTYYSTRTSYICDLGWCDCFYYYGNYMTCYRVYLCSTDSNYARYYLKGTDFAFNNDIYYEGVTFDVDNYSFESFYNDFDRSISWIDLSNMPCQLSLFMYEIFARGGFGLQYVVLGDVLFKYKMSSVDFYGLYAQGQSYQVIFESWESESYQIGYDNGYNTGYDTGYNTGYDIGLNAGYDNGYNQGYENGKTDGISTANDYTFLGLFGAVADTPVMMIRSLFNFDFFGVNLLTVVLSLFTGVILFYLLRKLL